jgi:hypothetical protein
MGKTNIILVNFRISFLTKKELLKMPVFFFCKLQLKCCLVENFNVVCNVEDIDTGYKCHTTDYV